jgi:glycosyltransferase involved in cell wall biosynthesis
MRPPDYSIVIPCWGAPYARALPEAVASIRRQSPQAPIIIVDNCSTEPLPPLAGTEVVRLDRRRTVGAARNAGLARVRTPFVVVADADDLVLDGALESLAEILRSEPRTVAAVGAVIEDGGRPHPLPRAAARWAAPLPPLLAFLHAAWGLFPIQGCAMMRIETAQGVGGYGDTDGGEDRVLGVALAASGRIRFLSRPVLDYLNPAGGLGAKPDRAELRRRATNVRRRLRQLGWGSLRLTAVRLAQAAAIDLLRPLVLRVRSGRG